MENNFDLIISNAYPEDRFNLLTPMKTVAEIAEIHKPVMNVVRISTNLNDKEIYEQDKANHGYAITKKGLEKLMRAAGIKIVDSKPIPPSTCRKCAEMNKAIGTPVNCYKCGNKDVAHEVTILVPQLTGESIEITKTKEICVDEVTKNMSVKQRDEFMKFRCEMCETKAMNRALRSAMHIKGTYTLEEFKRPFVVAYLVPNVNNPDVKAEAIKGMFSASDKLFGKNSLSTSAEAPAPEPPTLPAQDQQALPENLAPPYEPPYEPPVEPPYYEQQGYYNQPAPQQTTNSVCQSCGAPISQKVKEYSTNRFGRALCMECQKNVQGGRR